MATNYAMKLGTAGFTIDDLPEELPLVGEQIIAVRQFPGGSVHIQAFGAFDDEMNWQGDFMGDNAFQRAEAIDNLRKAGNVVLLQIGSIARYVLITKFTMQYRNDSYVSYDISLQPSGASLNSVSVGSTPTKSPAPPPVSKPTASTSKPPPKRTYVIKKGDTLWALAVKYYGNGSDWTKIQSANPGIVPTKLKIGSTIVIPY